MYRSPKTASSGASGFVMLLFILWGALYVAGCADVSTGTGLDLPESSDPVEIELAVNEELTSLLVEDISNTLGPDITAPASLLLNTATNLFAAARSADRSGDPERVVRHGAEARTAVARALQAGGDRPLREYIDRTRHLRDRVASGDAADEFTSPSEVLSALNSAVAAIESDMARGDDLGAGRRAVRANQEADRQRDRKHDRDRDRTTDHNGDRRGLEVTDALAGLWVGMAGESVTVADRFLEGTQPSERQIHALESAIRMTTSASEALASGKLRRAITFAHRAVSLSLIAVVLPEITAEDADAIGAFAAAELEAAASRDLNEQELGWLERAQATFDLGMEKIRDGELRGVNLVWRAGLVAAVIAR
jgi:hypothetical protein